MRYDIYLNMKYPDKRQYKATGIGLPSDSAEYKRRYYHLRLKKRRRSK